MIDILDNQIMMDNEIFFINFDNNFMTTVERFFDCSSVELKINFITSTAMMMNYELPNSKIYFVDTISMSGIFI